MVRLAALAIDLARLSRGRRACSTPCAVALVLLVVGVVLLISLLCWLAVLLVVFKSW